MARRGKSVFGLLIAALPAGLAATAPAARAAEERQWILGGVENKNADSVYLGYGIPETDDSFGSFTCKPASGEVKIWIAETSAKLKPGTPVTAVLSAGGAKTRVAGRLTPNEEAGVPSFEGTFKAADPIMKALAGAAALEVVVGPSKQSAPLAGAADKFTKFAAACARP
jgi:hypothetical protein